jgi:GNAT superfamily N-acetyltransferase
MLKTRILNSADLQTTLILFNEYRQFYGQKSDLEASQKFLLDRIQKDDSVLIGAFDNSKQIGFVQLYPSFSSIAMAHKLILNDLFVAESARRTGAATALLNAAKQLAIDTGAASLVLATQLTNTSARTLYERSGWSEEQEFIHYNYKL